MQNALFYEGIKTCANRVTWIMPTSVIEQARTARHFTTNLQQVGQNWENTPSSRSN